MQRIFFSLLEVTGELAGDLVVTIEDWLAFGGDYTGLVSLQ